MPKIQPVNDSEVAWVKDQLAGAAKFVAEFSPADADAAQPLTPAVLDRAFAAWMKTTTATASKSSDASSINAVINHVGIAFGQSLVEGIGFTWVIATDEHGSELAVYALPGRGDVLVYPANLVAKRWERRETNFLEVTYQRIAQDVRAVFRQWRARDPV